MPCTSLLSVIVEVVTNTRITSQYRRQTHFSTTHRRRQNFYALPKKHQDTLTRPKLALLDTFSVIDDAIDENADIADAILELALSTFDLPEKPEKGSIEDWHDKARALDLNKAHSTIKQFCRDWSAEGYNLEVKPVLDIVLQDLDTFLGVRRFEVKALLPGAGLGRLLFGLCLAGCSAEGNEISYHQLLASNWVLNTTQTANQYKLYPFINSFNNHISRSNQLRCVTIPDIHPASAMAQELEEGRNIGEMNMTAGDFITSYSSSDSTATFNAVITVYFIDTAPNIIRYIETISNCLKEGGVWINIGPLLWHFEDRNAESEYQAESTNSEGVDAPGSFELTDQEVLELVTSSGFEILSHEILPASVGGYIQDPAGMMTSAYKCSHWVARKTAVA